MVGKARGDAHGRTKLTQGRREQLRHDHQTGEFTVRQLAERYGVDASTISRAVRGLAGQVIEPEPLLTPATVQVPSVGTVNTATGEIAPQVAAYPNKGSRMAELDALKAQFAARGSSTVLQEMRARDVRPGDADPKPVSVAPTPITPVAVASDEFYPEKVVDVETREIEMVVRPMTNKEARTAQMLRDQAKNVEKMASARKA